MLSVSGIAEYVKSIIFDHAEIAKLKTKKANPNENISEPWFDDDCKKRKK